MLRIIHIIPLMIGLASPLHAQTLIGDWNCLEQPPEGEVHSQVTFKPNGRMHAKIQYKIAFPDAEILGTARYKGKFGYTAEGHLTDIPMSAKITSLTGNGMDIKNSEVARQLKAALLEDNGTLAEIKVLTSSQLVIRADGRDITCKRPQGYLGS
ncbi:hypothetical protein NBRC116594_06890 [Shimia sp. NS0008-38b]|uniref:hypothetical protein n=1 Tax=Shimia sp. NS0008-38b TaxID=3127653 RepID=UPI0031097DFD